MTIGILSLGIQTSLIHKEILSHLLNQEVNIITHSYFKETKVTEIIEQFSEVPHHDYFVITNAKVFKALAKVSNADKYSGYVLPCKYSDSFLVYCPNPSTIFTNPEIIRKKIAYCMSALNNHIQDNYKPPGDSIIHSAYYPSTTEEIAVALSRLLEMNVPLTIDIETFSLKHYNSGIATISFAWNKHEGVAFAIDYFDYNPEVRKLLLNFFLAFKQKAIYHNASFDIYILIYQLFMDEMIDTEGLLNGLEIMLNNFDDTKLISYLATNSCAGNKLSLKDQAQEFAGNYGMTDIEDIRKIPLKDLLQYNLVDSLSTWFVYHKHWNTLIQDNQLEIYSNLFKPAIKDIIQMQLTGMPIDLNQVKKVKAQLQQIAADNLTALTVSPIVIEYVELLNAAWVVKKNTTLKVKRVTIENAKEAFNPNSNQQLQGILYNLLELPILAYTDTRQPCAGNDTLKKLLNHTNDSTIITLLKSIIAFKDANKILTTFIPALEDAVCTEEGNAYLFGSFNLGGTVSGRLSSSKINLQNLPSNSVYGDLIKSCFSSVHEWLFVGIDFNALEARIGALLPKDSMKLSVYLQGYDSHSLATFHYFSDKLLDLHTQYKSILDSEKEYYQVIHDSGVTEYLTEIGFNLREYLYES